MRDPAIPDDIQKAGDKILDQLGKDLDQFLDKDDDYARYMDQRCEDEKAALRQEMQQECQQRMDALARTDEDDEKTDPWQAWVRDFPEWKEGRHAWDRVARDIREHAEDKPEMVYGAMMNEVQAEAIPDIARQARQYQLARPDHNDTRLRHEIEYRRMMTARARKRFFPGAPTMCYASVKDRMLAALAENNASRDYVTQWLDWLEAKGGGQREELFWAQMDEETEEKV